ncbi:hypothetical protein ACHAXR_012334 [Thalassiosira sp. AJA248-18]
MFDPQSKTTFTCPICLDNNEVNGTPDSGDAKTLPEHNFIDQSSGNPVFKLTSCNHQFCTACLRAYVRSKLMDGEVRIHCCHFRISLLEDDFQPCDVLIEESDIHDLLHADEYDEPSKSDDWCCSSTDGNSYSFRSSSKESSKKGGEGNQLWTKYLKMKFDDQHGKDAVRRCPKCDDAQLFDEERMKEYQSKYLSTDTSTPSDGRNASEGYRGRLERAFNTFRHRQRDTEARPSAAASNEKVDSNNPAPKEGGVIQEKEPSTEDGEHLESANPIPPSSSNDEEEACNSQEGGSSNGSADSKLSETDTPTAQQGESSLVKSTKPIVLCQNCSTEFCYFHSNAHSGKSCVEYHKKNLEMDRTNAEYANRILKAKPCPTCGISVSKEGGCNQIKCGSCGTHFCWLCSKVVDDGAFPEHFRWWNLRGCANMQLDENEEPLVCTLYGAKLLSLLQIIVLGIPALVLSLFSLILCPCFVPGCGRTNRERAINCISFWGSFLSSLLLLPFTCLGMLVLSALYCFLAAVALFFKVLNPQAGASSDSNSAPERVNNTSRDVPAGDAGNSASAENLIRELESIFERMEEGRPTLQQINE